MADLDLTDAELESVLLGTVPEHRRDLAALAGVFATLRRGASTEPAPAMSDELRALLAGEPDVVIDLRQRSPRRAITGGALAFTLVMGLAGVAAANDALPSGLQGFVADLGDSVGIDVPDGDRGHAGEDPQPDHGNDVNGHDPQGPPADAPAATPADPGEPGGGATPATPPVSTPRPDEAGTGTKPADAGQPDGTGQPADAGKPADAGSPRD